MAALDPLFNLYKDDMSAWVGDKNGYSILQMINLLLSWTHSSILNAYLYGINYVFLIKYT